ncbi:MAG TPA: serine/threonine-protein kinase [Terriglobia bacterium]|jgi:serine/threonine-protein kinase
MKKLFTSDLFFGIVLTLFVAGSYLIGSTFLESVELKFYDVRAKFRQESGQPNDVAIIAIDDNSLTQLGRWPWPRSRIAAMLDKVGSYGPKVIGLNILFSEPDHNPGIAALDQLATRYKELAESKVVIENDPASKKPLAPGAPSAILEAIDTAKQSLDEDAKLAASLKGKKVVLPMFFDLSAGLGGKPDPLPPEIARSAMTILPSGSPNYVVSEKASYPVALFMADAVGIGHINVVPDRDGTVRRVPVSVAYGDAMYPAYALELLRVYLGLDSKDLKIAQDDKVILGGIEAPLDETGLMNITFRGPERTFPYYSFFDVLNDKVNPDQFKDRIVLLGSTAIGLDSRWVTPTGTNFNSVELTANIIDDLLTKKFLVRPSWARAAELLLILFVGIFVSLLLPRMKAAMGAIVSLVFLAALLVTGTWMFVSQNYWLKVTYPSILLAAGYTVIVSKRFLTTEKRKELVEASQIETNKMLGLSFQGQGMLDLAFEKFRTLPLDEAVADLLYNLSLDFERKRQYNKAVAVYDYIATKFKGYKDITTRLENLKKAADGAVFGSSVGRGKDSTIMTESGGMKPTLGRYEVEKELGRGAMGIVYLGRDPKINRQVAIKTMMLELEGTAEQVKELKSRFFREAESAGNLNHPNIVRIFDAGEENEIAYIAMELLEGHDLKRYCDKASLLPLETVLDFCAKTADGLDYAHQAGVIHRDIKPANIMLLKDGTLRTTDFGIARMAASSKTATGTVMGTPSYMSPEQVSGKKVDGRSDLWSLGVMLYELSTGEKPFKGGDAIGTLLFQIANDTPTPPATYRPDLPADVIAVIDKCLQKDPDARYQRGADLAADLRRVIERLKSGTPAPVVNAAPAAAVAAAAATAAADKTAVLGNPLKPDGPDVAGDRTIHIDQNEKS